MQENKLLQTMLILLSVFGLHFVSFKLTLHLPPWVYMKMTVQRINLLKCLQPMHMYVLLLPCFRFSHGNVFRIANQLSNTKCIGVVAIGTFLTWALPDKERNLSTRNQKYWSIELYTRKSVHDALEGYHFQINACPCLLFTWNIPNSQLVSHFIGPNGCLSQMLY